MLAEQIARLEKENPTKRKAPNAMETLDLRGQVMKELASGLTDSELMAKAEVIGDSPARIMALYVEMRAEKLGNARGFIEPAPTQLWRYPVATAVTILFILLFTAINIQSGVINQGGLLFSAPFTLCMICACKAIVLKPIASWFRVVASLLFIGFGILYGAYVVFYYPEIETPSHRQTFQAMIRTLFSGMCFYFAIPSDFERSSRRQGLPGWR